MSGTKVVRSSQSEEWTRSSQGYVAGVCQGLSEQFDLNPTVLRLVWLLSVIFMGTGLLIYLAFWVALPVVGERADKSRLLGVCLRISRRQNMNVGLVRLITLLLTGLSAGATVVGYIVVHLLLQERTSQEI